MFIRLYIKIKYYFRATNTSIMSTSFKNNGGKRRPVPLPATDEVAVLVVELVDKEPVTKLADKELVTELVDKEPVTKLADKELVTELADKKLVTELTDKKLDAELADKKLVTELADKELDAELTDKKLVTELADKELDTELTDKKLDAELADKELVTELADKELVTEFANKKLVTELADKQLVTELADKKLVTEFANKELVTELTDKEPVTEFANKELVTELANKKLDAELTDKELDAELTDKEPVTKGVTSSTEAVAVLSHRQQKQAERLASAKLNPPVVKNNLIVMQKAAALLEKRIEVAYNSPDNLAKIFDTKPTELTFAQLAILAASQMHNAHAALECLFTTAPTIDALHREEQEKLEKRLAALETSFSKQTEQYEMEKKRRVDLENKLVKSANDSGDNLIKTTSLEKECEDLRKRNKDMVLKVAKSDARVVELQNNIQHLEASNANTTTRLAAAEAQIALANASCDEKTKRLAALDDADARLVAINSQLAAANEQLDTVQTRVVEETARAAAAALPINNLLQSLSESIRATRASIDANKANSEALYNEGTSKSISASEALDGERSKLMRTLRDLLAQEECVNTLMQSDTIQVLLERINSIPEELKKTVRTNTLRTETPRIEPYKAVCMRNDNQFPPSATPTRASRQTLHELLTTPENIEMSLYRPADRQLPPSVQLCIEASVNETHYTDVDRLWDSVENGKRVIPNTFLSKVLHQIINIDEAKQYLKDAKISKIFWSVFTINYDEKSDHVKIVVYANQDRYASTSSR